MRWFVLAMTSVVLSAACSDTAEPPAKATSPASSASTPAAATVAGAASAAPKASGAAASATNDACTLITPDEVGRVMGVTGVKTEPLTGDPAYCSYRDGNGALVVATSLLRKDSAVAYSAWAGSARSVTGLGEKAQWEPSTATLMVQKGGAVLSITAGPGSMPEAERQDRAKQLGALGVARQ